MIVCIQITFVRIILAGSLILQMRNILADMESDADPYDAQHKAYFP